MWRRLTSELGVCFELDDEPPVLSDKDPDDLETCREDAVRLDTWGSEVKLVRYHELM